MSGGAPGEYAFEVNPLCFYFSNSFKFQETSNGHNFYSTSPNAVILFALCSLSKNLTAPKRWDFSLLSRFSENFQKVSWYFSFVVFECFQRNQLVLRITRSLVNLISTKASHSNIFIVPLQYLWFSYLNLWIFMHLNYLYDDYILLDACYVKMFELQKVWSKSCW